MNLVQSFLEKSAERLPRKTALVCEGRRLSYAEIEQKANALANYLLKSGLKRGQRVILFMPNCTELVIAIFAVLKADGVFVIVNYTTKHDKLLYILRNCQASFLLSLYRQVKLKDQISEDLPELKVNLLQYERQDDVDAGNLVDLTRLEENYSTQRPYPQNIDRDLGCLIYTSGSTGEPKGVMCDHSNMVFAADSVSSYLGNVEEDVVINFLPFSFDYGLYQLFMIFKVGGTLVLEKGFAFPALILKKITEERVTGFPAVTTIFTMLLSMDLSKYDLSSIRYLTNTAEALPPAVILKLQAQFPNAKVFSMYGLTETQRTLYMPPEHLDQRLDSVGIAIPGTEVWLEDVDGKRLGPGSQGALVARGRHVMRGYWQSPEASAARFREGGIPGERVCYTDDLFRMDEEGFLYFVSRRDDIIKSGGEKVAPVEVEKVLYKLEGVVEAAVIGVNDPVQGQAIKAFVVTSDTGLSARKVQAHCRRHLEDYMVPRLIEFREELPRTTSNKIKKSDLK